MTKSTTLFSSIFALAAAFALAGCFSSSPEEPGVLAMNLRTGETRTFEGRDNVPQGWILCPEVGCPAPAACGELDEADCLARADCSPIYAEGHPDDADPYAGCVEAGDGLCDAEDCGPQPGMPAIECDDGSIGGFTGRCVVTDDGGCGWEILECPAPCDCGPAPGAAQQCDDGSTAVTECLRLADGTCGWRFECVPADECSADECGPQPGMPAIECEDGSIGGNTGNCLRNADGVCGWEIRECPVVEECDPAACGPAPGAHPQCPDGSESETQCLAALDGTCGWQFICGGEPL